MDHVRPEPALAQGYSAVIIATPLNTQCVASALEKGTDEIHPVKTYKYPAEEKSKPAWKAFFPLSQLAKLKKTIGSTAYAPHIPYPISSASAPMLARFFLL